jgi:transcriptional regulator with XRE-family HTH domain
MGINHSNMSANHLEGQLQALGTSIAAQRLERNWLQRELAQAAGVSLATLRRLEAGQSVQLANWLRVLSALGLLDRLDLLLAKDDPFAALEQQRTQPKRQRASRKAPEPAPSTWTWGEDR